MKNLNKKIIATVFILLILVPSIIFVPTQQAVAVDIGSIVGGGAGAILFCSGLLNQLGGFLTGLLGGLISSKVPIVNQSDDAKEGCWDHLAFMVANILIEETSRQTINWINGTTDGQPKFVTNLGSYL
jgi:hypothetical protein